jgi:hypothetical protein
MAIFGWTIAFRRLTAQHRMQRGYAALNAQQGHM